jgi:hypothetical protein
MPDKPLSPVPITSFSLDCGSIPAADLINTIANDLPKQGSNLLKIPVFLNRRTDSSSL